MTSPLQADAVLLQSDLVPFREIIIQQCTEDFIGSGSVTGNVTTDASGTATFAIGVSVVKDLKDCTLTVGGTAITLVSSSKTLAAGKIYNISRIAGV
jgi:hypothetical protein